MKRKVITNLSSTSNPFGPATSQSGLTSSLQFEEAVVVDVIVNNDHSDYSKDGYNVGAVKFRFLNSNFYRPDESLNWAFPVDSNISEYPLINEIVYVFQALNRFYYMKKFNVANRPTTQPFFGLNDEAQPAETSSENIKNIRSAQASPVKPSTAKPAKLGKYFKDLPTIQRLKHLEGDLVFEGRSGQSIRFGTSWLDGTTNDVTKKPFKSSTTDQSPNLLMRIGPSASGARTVPGPFGLTVEDINADASSIWMVSDQIVPLRMATKDSKIHALSTTAFPKTLSDNQIIINSDRIVLNSKKDKLIGSSANGIHWMTLQDYTTDVDGNHTTWTNKIRADRVLEDWRLVVGKTLTLSAQENVIQIGGKNHSIFAGTNLSLVGNKIFIGTANSTEEPLVLGKTLKEFLTQLIEILVQEPLILMTGAPGSPSAQNPMRVSKLKQLSSTYLSGNAKILSLDNFTVKKNDSPQNAQTIGSYQEG